MREYMQYKTFKEKKSFSAIKDGIRNEINIRDIEKKIKVEGNIAIL